VERFTSASKAVLCCGSLLVRNGQTAARFSQNGEHVLHLAMQRERRITKVAMARKQSPVCAGCGVKRKVFDRPVEVGSYAGWLVTAYGGVKSITRDTD